MHGSYGVIANRMMPRMIEAGLSVSLGTDSATAGRFLDMVRVMYLAACAHKDAYADPLKVGAYKALEMATIDGARACLWDDEIGSLEPGKKADLVIIDMEGLHWAPPIDPINSLVYAANGSDVETVVIDGRIVMKDKVLTTVDERFLRRGVAAAARGLAPPRWDPGRAAVARGLAVAGRWRGDRGRGVWRAKACRDPRLSIGGRRHPHGLRVARPKATA